MAHEWLAGHAWWGWMDLFEPQENPDGAIVQKCREAGRSETENHRLDLRG